MLGKGYFLLHNVSLGAYRGTLVSLPNYSIVCILMVNIVIDGIL